MQAVKKRAIGLNMKFMWMKLMVVSCRLKFFLNQRHNSTHPPSIQMVQHKENYISSTNTTTRKANPRTWDTGGPARL
eukprot:12112582-Prorocentrum_lima.AAC.1